jgi:hypothetical protein
MGAGGCGWQRERIAQQRRDRVPVEALERDSGTAQRLCGVRPGASERRLGDGAIPLVGTEDKEDPPPHECRVAFSQQTEVVGVGGRRGSEFRATGSRLVQKCCAMLFE